MKTEHTFRVGGIYLDATDGVCRIDAHAEPDGFAHVSIYDHEEGEWTAYGGLFNLTTGRYEDDDPLYWEMHLTPREVQYIDGEWVPVGELDAQGNPINEQPARAVPDLTPEQVAFHAGTRGVCTVPAEPESARAPLPYFTERTPFDAFKGMQFEVRRGGYLREEEAMYAPQGPLQRLSSTDTALIDPSHALAAVRDASR